MEAHPSWLAGNPAVARWRETSALRRRQILLAACLAVGLVFPFTGVNGGHIDAAANAYTYVLLALGLNIVVGFAGLLDLGYAAFFAIGAYGYGIAASGQLKFPWSELWGPLVWLGQVTRVHVEGQPDFIQLNFSFWGMLLVEIGRAHV